MSRLNVANFRHPDATADNISLDSSGRVGIGTSSPNKPLHINGGSSDAEIRLQTNSGTENNGYVVIRESDGRLDLYSTNGEIRLHPSNTERMRLDTSGNLQFNSGYGSVATAYGVRAWIQFQGTGTVTIRGTGNLTSLTDNGTGDYSISFVNEMPDDDYGLICSCREDTNNISTTTNRVCGPRRATSATTTTGLRVGGVDFGYSVSDLETVYLAVIR